MIYNSQEYARLRNAVLSVSVIAWIAILLEPGAATCCQASDSATSLKWLLYSTPATSLARGWAVMLIAMMAPRLVTPIYHIWISSFARRRARSIALFLAGYGTVWMAAGVVMVAAELTAKCLAFGSYLPASGVAIVALVWQASPFKQRCLNRCHSHRPLAAFGIAADWATLRLGLEHGLWCTASCWATMLLPMLLPQGHLLAMAAVSILMYCESLDPPRAPSWRLRGFGTAWRYLRLRLRDPQAGGATFAPGAQTHSTLPA